MRFLQSGSVRRDVVVESRFFVALSWVANLDSKQNLTTYRGGPQQNDLDVNSNC